MNRPAVFWNTFLRHYFQCDLPDNYVCFDFETTGFGRDDSVPVDLAWCKVRDNEIVSEGRYVLDWTLYPEYLSEHELEAAFNRIAFAFAKKQEHWIYDVPYLKQHGVDPAEVMERFYEVLQENRREGGVFVGHNAVGADAPMVETLWPEVVDSPWVFGPNELIDTGVLEKICECVAKNDLESLILPKPGQTLREYLTYAARVPRKGIQWSLRHCVEKYGLAKAGLVDQSKQHTALEDSRMCHYLLQKNKQAYAAESPNSPAVVVRAGDRPRKPAQRVHNRPQGQDNRRRRFRRGI